MLFSFLELNFVSWTETRKYVLWPLRFLISKYKIPSSVQSQKLRLQHKNYIYIYLYSITSYALSIFIHPLTLSCTYLLIIYNMANIFSVFIMSYPITSSHLSQSCFFSRALSFSPLGFRKPFLLAHSPYVLTPPTHQLSADMYSWEACLRHRALEGSHHYPHALLRFALREGLQETSFSEDLFWIIPSLPAKPHKFLYLSVDPFQLLRVYTIMLDLVWH